MYENARKDLDILTLNKKSFKCQRLTIMRLLLLAAALTATSFLATGNAVKITRLDVPSVVDPRRDRVFLRCQYDLGKLELYSVNWYRNDDVIFRYMPNSNPKVVIYKNDGVVNVSQEDSSNEQLVLIGSSDFRKNKEAYEGTYVCEVSAEAPFPTAYAIANMTVAILPQTNPVLEGLRQNYQVGNVLEAECTSAPSFPASELTFYVNGREVDKSLARKLQVPMQSGMIGEISRLALTLRLERQHFLNAGSLTLSCDSRLPGIPLARVLRTEKTVQLSNVNNQRLERDKPIPAMSTRASGAPNFRVKLSLILIGGFFFVLF